MKYYIYKLISIVASRYYKTVVAIEYRWFRLFGPPVWGVHPRYQLYAHRHMRKMRKLANQMVKFLRKNIRNRASFKRAVNIYNFKWQRYCDKQLNKYRNLAPDRDGFKRFINNREGSIRKAGYGK